jgi:hypothetical protein
MSENIWDRFENIASADEVTEAKKKYEPVDAGEYDAVLEKIEPAESQNGQPMIKGQFRTVEGNRTLFYNQNLQNINYPDMTAVNIAEAVKFISAITGEDVEFTGMGAFATLISEIPCGQVYRIKVSYGKKDTTCKYAKLTCIGKVDDLPFDN